MKLMRGFLRDEGGRSVVLLVLKAVGVMALAATSVETGHAYRKLAASANAAGR